MPTNDKTNEAKKKAMQEKRANLREKGLKAVTVHIKPEDRDKLYRYVTERLKGHCPPKSNKW